MKLLIPILFIAMTSFGQYDSVPPQKIIPEPVYTPPEPVEEICEVPEQQPQFPGGEQELMKYLKETVSYPIVSREMGLEGKVYVQFIIEKDGSIRTVKVARSVDTYLDREAMRVVRNMPNWIPGKCDGEVARVRMILPIVFRLEKTHPVSEP